MSAPADAQWTCEMIDSAPGFQSGFNVTIFDPPTPILFGVDGGPLGSAGESFGGALTLLFRGGPISPGTEQFCRLEGFGDEIRNCGSSWTNPHVVPVVGFSFTPTGVTLFNNSACTLVVSGTKAVSNTYPPPSGTLAPPLPTQFLPPLPDAYQATFQNGSNQQPWTVTFGSCTRSNGTTTVCYTVGGPQGASISHLVFGACDDIQNATDGDGVIAVTVNGRSVGFTTGFHNVPGLSGIKIGGNVPANSTVCLILAGSWRCSDEGYTSLAGSVPPKVALQQGSNLPISESPVNTPLNPNDNFIRGVICEQVTTPSGTPIVPGGQITLAPNSQSAPISLATFGSQAAILRLLVRCQDDNTITALGLASQPALDGPEFFGEKVVEKGTTKTGLKIVDVSDSAAKTKGVTPKLELDSIWELNPNTLLWEKVHTGHKLSDRVKQLMPKDNSDGSTSLRVQYYGTGGRKHRVRFKAFPPNGVTSFNTSYDDVVFGPV
jgi:hypothetical protein